MNSEIGIDHELVINTEEELFEMNNGCICCTVRGSHPHPRQSAETQEPVRSHSHETTGLADPGPVVQTFLTMTRSRRNSR
jgi:G3E family GTPase